MKKINRKGFTLIELIAVIVILSIILIVVTPNLIETYKESKLKSEGLFIKQLTKSVESYVSLYGSEMTFTEESGTYYKQKTIKTKESCQVDRNEVKVYKSETTIQEIINKNIIEESEYRNPGNKDTKCNPEAEIEVYRDSDYVYCFKIRKDAKDAKEAMECLTQEYKDSIKETTCETLDNSCNCTKTDEEPTPTDYVIDTCIWKTGE